jgi:hypothetical protein
MLTNAERAARAMSKRERIAFVKAAGWELLSSLGSQSWIDPQTGGTYTLAMAVRVAIEDANPPTDTPTLRAGFELQTALGRMRFGDEPPMVCDGCHATADRIAKRGHYGHCDRGGMHGHVRGMEIKNCPEWIAHLHLLNEQLPRRTDAPMSCARRDRTTVADNRAAHGYVAVLHCDDLPARRDEDGHLVHHGYALDAAGVWYFSTHLEPAITAGRALRMSPDCPSYGVFRAAQETRFCERHGDEQTLVVVGDRLDRQPGEAEILARFAAGVAEHPESSHWHAPGAGR